ncbi:SDR family oxidoreductase [Rhizobium leguminosarum]|uniref:SDR family NAD(P)-dependent oxidoreductase n=1 Tax=Rhizobium leguminosarum TaxID=384 RepID=UPI001C980B02|nr:SDR family oxidoreductase [Rhizobium leguminosarum]MBY5569059.1 SDR family oxidoreductase [Rhizobium leguminosarum]MBY5576182.1 SDR family oxidoreductase [Rhizobium leguminosarum]MBY5586239.1 SDR family oxidoreductase [Rhizobium leguminosarum]MBY5601217.1 SDR family oxidoreductase [Rhizobium leguminosarum]
MGRLTGKIAIITGASRGIGRATAKLFAAEGAKVAVLSRTSEGVERVVADIVDAGGTALSVVCDVGEADQITAAVDKVVATYGRIDILVNNAFDGSAVLSSVIDLSVEQLQRNFDTGPIAYLRFMQACYPHLRAGRDGRIINFGSMAGTVGLAGYGPYNMAKEAVRALTRTAAREWGADNITVNNVLPIADTWGAEKKDIPPPTNALARFGSPEDDIAPVVLFLASKDSQFITGYSLTPDGGAIIDSAR